MARKGRSPVKPAKKPGVRLYTLEVFIISGPITEKFVKKNPVISRTIQIRGDQTLEDFHEAIFAAFHRNDEHLYEFQFGKRPMDPKAKRYAVSDVDDGASGLVDETTIDSLDLKVGRSFGYWFDFGDDWWHQVDVTAIEESAPRGKYPKVTAKVGKSPPQYADQ